MVAPATGHSIRFRVRLFIGQGVLRQRGKVSGTYSTPAGTNALLLHRTGEYADRPGQHVRPVGRHMSGTARYSGRTGPAEPARQSQSHLAGTRTRTIDRWLAPGWARWTAVWCRHGMA